MKTETIKTRNGTVVEVLPSKVAGCVYLHFGSDVRTPTFDARNANQLARALRNAALQVESEGEQKR